MAWKYKLAPITALHTVHNACRTAIEEKQLIVLIGKTGYGKSIGLLSYKKGNQNECIYSAIKPAQRAKGYFSGLIHTLHGNPGDETVFKQSYIHWLIEKSSFEIMARKTPSLLIVDEAGNFKRNSQSFLRQIWDNIGGKCGMIISGPSRYEKNLHQWNEDDSSGIPEFVSRINNWITIPEPSYDDISLICLRNNIEDKKVIQYIYENSPHLRRVKSYVMAHHEDLLGLQQLKML